MQLSSVGQLSITPDDANVILFNSHHCIEEIISLKKSYPHKVFIHRVDGPMRLYNEMSDGRDAIVYNLNAKIADGTIFQSQFSLDSNKALGLTIKGPVKVIPNAVDSSVFYPNPQKLSRRKIKIISSSFSPNIKKGFQTYKFLDENLDFNLFEYSFVGQSPYQFKNIRCLGVLSSGDLAQALRENHIYITASQNDPCSNSLIEAVFSGLTCFALNSGGHPELLEVGDSLFDTPEELLQKLISFREGFQPHYVALSNSLEKTTMEYSIFMESLL